MATIIQSSRIIVLDADATLVSAFHRVLSESLTSPASALVSELGRGRLQLFLDPLIREYAVMDKVIYKNHAVHIHAKFWQRSRSVSTSLPYSLTAQIWF